MTLPGSKASCPFCRIQPDMILAENDLAFLVADNYPISPGHVLVIPKRHVASFFETTAGEESALFELVRLAHKRLSEDYHPDGFNVGINDGPAAGQTVMHLHIHVIPRYRGDRPDPRGGVRWIKPEKADYWSGERT